VTFARISLPHFDYQELRTPAQLRPTVEAACADPAVTAPRPIVAARAVRTLAAAITKWRFLMCMSFRRDGAGQVDWRGSI
jgi:hypothetical protein